MREACLSQGVERVELAEGIYGLVVSFGIGLRRNIILAIIGLSSAFADDLYDLSMS